MTSFRKLLWPAMLLQLIVATPSGAVGNVVISQIYGGGGNPFAPWENDYVELFNRSGASVNLTGWPLLYAPGSQTSGAWSGYYFAPGTTLAAGSYLLVPFGS